VASAFSILDILYSLYFELTSDRTIDFLQHDTFILSKGHASLAIFAILEKAKLLDSDWVENFCKVDSRYGGHPDMIKVPGISASTGSLGHGLPFAVGLAMADKALGHSTQTYVLIGDGELNEGTNWESLLLASHHKLSNLTVIVDANRSSDRALTLNNLREKFESFGCSVAEVDGHDHQEMIHSFGAPSFDKPKAVIAETIKGYGISEMENNPAWHHAFPDSVEYEKMLAELK
jgi:transketolase